MEQPVLQPLPPKKQKLMRIYHIDLKKYGVPLKLKIPTGFIWDGASIPRIFWLTIGGPYHPTFSVAGLVHDYLYRRQPILRKAVDRIFYKLLRANGVGYITAKRMYFGVKTGGYFAWRKHKKALEKEG